MIDPSFQPKNEANADENIEQDKHNGKGKEWVNERSSLCGV